MKKIRILLTGFEPFGGEKINPASQAVEHVSCRETAEIIKLTVPTVFGKAEKYVIDAVKAYSPDAVIMVGQAGGRSAVTVERVAINVRDASIADNEGFMPRDEPVRSNGKAAYFSTLPIKKICDAVKAAGIACEISNTAGTFVCNSLMYGVLDYLDGVNIAAGFLHVPFIPEQVIGKPLPSMALPDITKALEAAIDTVIAELVGK